MRGGSFPESLRQILEQNMCKTEKKRKNIHGIYSTNECEIV